MSVTSQQELLRYVESNKVYYVAATAQHEAGYRVRGFWDAPDQLGYRILKESGYIFHTHPQEGETPVTLTPKARHLLSNRKWGPLAAFTATMTSGD